jgi:hypothetical protein
VRGGNLHGGRPQPLRGAAQPGLPVPARRQRAGEHGRRDPGRRCRLGIVSPHRPGGGPGLCRPRPVPPHPPAVPAGRARGRPLQPQGAGRGRPGPDGIGLCRAHAAVRGAGACPGHLPVPVPGRRRPGVQHARPLVPGAARGARRGPGQRRHLEQQRLADRLPARPRRGRPDRVPDRRGRRGLRAGGPVCPGVRRLCPDAPPAAREALHGADRARHASGRPALGGPSRSWPPSPWTCSPSSWAGPPRCCPSSRRTSSGSMPPGWAGCGRPRPWGRS